MAKGEKTKLTREEATGEVCKLLCRGLIDAQIAEHAAAEKWNFSATLLSTVIENAKARLREAAALLNIDTEVGTALVRLENLYNEAFGAKDFKTALAVQREKHKLLRLGERARDMSASRGASKETPKETSKEKRRGGLRIAS